MNYPVGLSRLSAAVFVLFLASVAFANVTSGMFSYYPFDADANDAVGANHGTMLNGAAIVADPERGNVLSLDGDNDYVSLPQNGMASGRSELTVTMWVRPDEWASSNAIYDEYGGDWGEYWQFSIYEGKWYTRDSTTGSTGSRNNDLNMPSLTPGQWHHLAFVYSVSESRKAIYYDGDLNTSTSNSVDTLTTSRAGADLGRPCDGAFYDGLVDELRFYNRALTDSEIAELASEIAYTLTVNSGTGDGNHIAGAIVPISADTSPSGYGFAAWTGEVGGIADIHEPDTTITMPASDVDITATYGWLYTLTVHSGLGDGNYAAGYVTDIFADAPSVGMAFDRWVGDISGVDDVYADSTSITMPGSDTTVTATYESVPGYYLSVKNGTGDGTYASGTIVDVTAYPPPAGQDFYEWVGDISGLADVGASQTTYTMPPADADVTASYRDQGAQTYEVHQDLDEAISRIYRLDDKPYLDLIDQNGFFQTETLIFHDTETGKEIWSLTREVCTDLANIERRTAWSSNGQYISFVSSKAFWDYRNNSLWNSSWAGYSHIANSDTSKRRKLWANGPGGLASYQDKFNNWDMVTPNRLYYPSGNKLVRVTLGPGNNDTDNTAEEIYTFPNSSSRIIQEVHDDNWLLIEESGGSPNCYLVNCNRPPTDPYFVLSYPLAGEVHPGSFRFRRSLWVCTGGYEYISGGITLFFDETSCWEGTLNTHLTSGVRPGHLWYGPPDDRRGFFGSYNGQSGLYLQHPGQWPVRMARVPDGHVTWCSQDPEWFFGAVGPGTTPDIQYERRLLACNADGTTVEIICRPWDRSKGTDGGYDKYPRPNQSPDATKCWFHADLLNPSNDYTGSYITVFRKPYAPTAVAYDSGQISYTPHALSHEVKSYLLYRNDGQSWQFDQEISAGTPAFIPGQDGTYMITSLEWCGIESDTSSSTVTVPGGSTGSPVSGWDTNPPAKPTGVSVTNEGPGRYRLVWTAPADQDLRYFNIYFSSIDAPQAIQQRRIASPTRDMAEYLDWTAPLGGSAYYAITAVDRQGNESDPAYPSGTTYALTVTNGSGSGEYEPGTVVDVSADAPATGKIFAMWIGDVTYVADRYQAVTTVTMPGWDAAVTATYAWAYALTVNSGSGDGQYTTGTVVDIQADAPATGWTFDQWTGDVANVADIHGATTTISMPPNDAEITATYNGGLSGDLDGDGFVGQGDLDIILFNWGASPPTDERADPSGDGSVGQADLDIVLANWGESL